MAQLPLGKKPNSESAIDLLEFHQFERHDSQVFPGGAVAPDSPVRDVSPDSAAPERIISNPDPQTMSESSAVLWCFHWRTERVPTSSSGTAAPFPLRVLSA
jgi:hypothetical protein